MLRRLITFLLITLVTAALSTWWLYGGNVRGAAPVSEGASP